ncbi:hypothetical protein GQ55_8G098200 [Panicum hallii var. hallii]|uniref:Uncharacterized protein n=1 Tax=Panicum hallii var. hallii TaxID=1504633 RepID=A0A2T7CM76_9POAL|nr:hypothetical protein GQ55_8G098200 [Panicum hallii var. hallii]
MAAIARRIRNLNLPEVEDAEPAEDEHDNSAENENNENLQGPPHIYSLLTRMPRHHPQSPIKIIWTDENGVPNERMHILRNYKKGKRTTIVIFQLKISMRCSMR